GKALAHVKLLQRYLTNEQGDQVAAGALNRPQEIADPKLSILARKPEFFDPALVEMMASCAQRDHESLGVFHECIRKSLAGVSPTDETWKKWAALPPGLETLSGVREHAF